MTHSPSMSFAYIPNICVFHASLVFLLKSFGEREKKRDHIAYDGNGSKCQKKRKELFSIYLHWGVFCFWPTKKRKKKCAALVIVGSLSRFFHGLKNGSGINPSCTVAPLSPRGGKTWTALCVCVRMLCRRRLREKKRKREEGNACGLVRAMSVRKSFFLIRIGARESRVGGSRFRLGLFLFTPFFALPLARHKEDRGESACTFEQRQREREKKRRKRTYSTAK